MKQERTPRGARSTCFFPHEKRSYIKEKTMKNKKNLTAILALILTVVALLGVFTACGGLPSADEREETTTKLPSWKDPPEISTIQTPDPIPEYTGEIVEPVEPQYTTRYAASSESNKYHRTSCHYVDQILSWNLIYFYSEESARRAGYSPCSLCNP